MIIEEYDDYDNDLDDPYYNDIGFKAEAYYKSNYSGLEDDALFTNNELNQLDDWIWSKAQQGLYVVVDDYEDDDRKYYRWPENAEYLDLSYISDIETDERGNFLNIEDIGLK